MDYGRAIRIVRAAKGLSQKELAELTGLNGTYISMIESGRRVPSTEALESIAKAMKVPFYLIALLGSDAEDLQGISREHASSLGQELLQLVVGNDKR
jgi:transcriptional regulator with XRE-family HTH domain